MPLVFSEINLIPTGILHDNQRRNWAAEGTKLK